MQGSLLKIGCYKIDWWINLELINNFVVHVSLRMHLVTDLNWWCMLQMVDANQCWGVTEAIDWMIPLAKYNLKWIEEPTSPDDIFGHAKISTVAVCTCFLCMLWLLTVAADLYWRHLLTHEPWSATATRVHCSMTIVIFDNCCNCFW